MIQYRLLALDLDGTLLNGKQEISPEDRAWIKRAQDAGVIVVLATGRGRKMSAQYWDVLDPASPVLLVNGNEVWKNHTEVLERHFLTREEVQDFLTLAETHHAWFWGNVVGDLVTKDNFTPAALDLEWLNFGIKHSDPATIEHLRELITGWDRSGVTSSAPSNLELSRPGVSKATGIAKIADLLGIGRSEVMAVGDSLNDLEMLRWVGFGVAMGNGDEKVKAAADAVTKSHDEGGVAQAIKEYMFGWTQVGFSLGSSHGRKGTEE